MEAAMTTVVESYIQAARFTEENQLSAIPKDMVKRIEAEIERFVHENRIPLDMNYSDYGRNLWYSRNGHGLGFFDTGHDKLQEAARDIGPDDDLVMLLQNGRESDV
jgi:hypothetical protein